MEGMRALNAKAEYEEEDEEDKVDGYPPLGSGSCSRGLLLR